MKYMIASDLHGSSLYTDFLLEAFRREKEDGGRWMLLLLGDLLYHGPRNDLPEAYDPGKVNRTLSVYADEIICVRGNCDAEVDLMVMPYLFMTDSLMLESGDHWILATHGHVRNEGNMPPLRPGDVLLHGHTHVPSWKKTEKGVWILNPGSVSIPKEGSWHGYMTLSGQTFTWKELTGSICHRMSL